RILNGCRVFVGEIAVLGVVAGLPLGGVGQVGLAVVLGILEVGQLLLGLPGLAVRLLGLRRGGGTASGGGTVSGTGLVFTAFGGGLPVGPIRVASITGPLSSSGREQVIGFIHAGRCKALKNAS